MDASNKISDFNLVLTLLKNGEILISFIKGKKTFFALKKDKIFCQNNSSSYSLTLLDFTSLFHDASFFIYENNESFIDIKKDEEYYHWNVLKK